MTPSPVKQAALSSASRCCSRSDCVAGASEDAVPRVAGPTMATLRDWQPDVIVVVAYGLILPRAVLELPRLGCLNIHASLLPRWRGAAPIQRAILAGDATTGVSIMQMDEGLDTGDVLLEAPLPIGAQMMAGELHDRLATLGAALLLVALEGLVQRHGGAATAGGHGRYPCGETSRTKRASTGIQVPSTIDRQVRAFNPWPVAETRLRGEPVKLLRSRVAPVRRRHGAPGTVMGLVGDALQVSLRAGRAAGAAAAARGAPASGARDFLNAEQHAGVQRHWCSNERAMQPGPAPRGRHQDQRHWRWPHARCRRWSMKAALPSWRWRAPMCRRRSAPPCAPYSPARCAGTCDWRRGRRAAAAWPDHACAGARRAGHGRCTSSSIRARQRSRWSTSRWMRRAWPGSRRAAGFVNALLRRYLRERDGGAAGVDRSEPAMLAHPRWLLQGHSCAKHGARASQVIAANNESPPMTLRVNQRGTRVTP